MYYPGRQLTADEILTAELSRDAAGNNLGDGSTNGTFAMRSVMTSRGILTKVASQITDQQHNNAFAFPPNQQVGVDPNHDLSYGDQSARRKRSKVSRACDECRRKKVSIGYIYSIASASCFRPYVGITNTFRIKLGPLRCYFRVWCRNMFKLPPSWRRMPVQSRSYEERTQ